MLSITINCRLMFNNTKLEEGQKKKSKVRQIRLRRAILEGKMGFISDKEALCSESRQVRTNNNRFHECAQTLSNGKLLARLSSGDAITQELKYQFAYLIYLYNKERTYLRATKGLEQERVPKEYAHPQAFPESITYLVETTRSNESPAVLDRVHLYAQCLEQLGVDVPAINSTRLEERLMTEIPELEAHKQGSDVILFYPIKTWDFSC